LTLLSLLLHILFFHFNVLNNLIGCLLCGKGTYGPSPGLTICVNCEKGKSQWVAGKTSCTDCQAGRANAKVKSTTADACIKCKKGNVENQTVDI